MEGIPETAPAHPLYLGRFENGAVSGMEVPLQVPFIPSELIPSLGIFYARNLAPEPNIHDYA